MLNRPRNARSLVRFRGLVLSLAGLAATPGLALLPEPAVAAPTSAIAEGASGQGDAVEAADSGHLAQLAQASTEAVSTGAPVEVESQTTETAQVMAEPDGSFTLTATTRPVRVKRNGRWHSIDPTLRRSPDGLITPVAVDADLSFGGGGDSLLVRLRTADDRVVELSWPTTLPEPTLAGDTATYADVLPGVDLKLIASAEGFRQVLVVEDAEAAANPALRKLRIATRAEGLVLREDPHEGLAAVDDHGVTRIQGSRPVMWDSSIDESGRGKGTARYPGDHVDEIDMTVDAADGRERSDIGEIELVPPHTALVGPDVTYPAFIDPNLYTRRTSDLPYSNVLVVQSGGSHYFNNDGLPMKVGLSSDGEGKGRSFFSFNLSPLSPAAGTVRAVVHSAQVNVWQQSMGAPCGTLVPTSLYTSDELDIRTWPGPARPSILQTVTSKHDRYCPVGEGTVVFGNTHTGVESYIRERVNLNQPNARFNLSAPDETKTNQRKTFGNDPTLTVNYDFPASVLAGSLKVASNVACGTKVYAASDRPSVTAVGIDNNPVKSTVNLRYEIHTSARNGVVRTNPTLIPATHSVPRSWSTDSANTNNAAQLPDGTYSVRVAAYSLQSAQTTGWSAWQDFIVDMTRPPTPGVESTDYPEGYWSAPQQGPGTFSLEGSSDTVAFTYSLDDAASIPLPIQSDCSYQGNGFRPATSGAATVTIPDLQPGYHTLYVKAIDGAHNASVTPAEYTFYVSPTFAGLGTTKFEAENLEPMSFAPDTYSFVEADLQSSGGSRSTLVAGTGDEGWPTTFTYGFETSVEAFQALGVQVATDLHYGRLRFDIDGVALKANGSDVFDAYSPTRGSQYVQLGGARLTAGLHHLNVSIVGTSGENFHYDGQYGEQIIENFDDNGRSASIDYFTVVPINNVTYDSLSAAFNNNGVATSTAGGDIELSSQNRAIEAAGMSAAGFGPGATVAVDGVTFKMPAHNGVFDNAMAMGQTIAMPKDASGNHAPADAVELLVMSTCGPTPSGAGVQLSTFHTGSTDTEDGRLTRDSEVAAIPDWLSTQSSADPVSGSTATRVSWSDVHPLTGSTMDLSVTPSLYHLHVPVAEDARSLPLTAITLPNVGSDFVRTAGCGRPILHVFAITTS